MEIEENIVYQLLDEVRAANLNDDEVIEERHIRAFLREHRGTIIHKSFNNGLTVTANEFQSFGIISLTLSGATLYYDLPSIIRLPNEAGIRLTSVSGYVIPIISKESFNLSLNNPVNQFLPKAYIEGDRLVISKGASNPDSMNNGNTLDSIISTINNKQVHLDCILHNPDDLSSYDWTKSPYPLSDELIPLLKDLVKRKNLRFFLETKSDEVTNAKNDNIRYHEQGNVK